MKKTMSIVAIALMMAGSSVYACGGCGCQDKKAEKKAVKEKSECGSCSKSEKKETACGGAKKADEAKKAA